MGFHIKLCDEVCASAEVLRCDDPSLDGVRKFPRPPELSLLSDVDSLAFVRPTPDERLARESSSLRSRNLVFENDMPFAHDVA